MDHSINVKHIATLVGISMALLTGCATNPKQGLPGVQGHVSEQNAVRVAWPQSAEEKVETDRAVNELLRPDLTSDTAVQIAVLNNRGLRAIFEEIGLSQADLIAAGRLHNPAFFASVRWPNQRPRGPD